MTRDEIQQIKLIARDVAKEEISLAIESLKEDIFKPPSQERNKPDISAAKKEEKKDGERL